MVTEISERVSGLYNHPEGVAAAFIEQCYIASKTAGLNFWVPVRPEKVDMFSRIGGRPTGATVRSPLAWAASAEDNKADEAD